MPENNPALALCPNCLRPLALPPGYAGSICPGHAPPTPVFGAWPGFPGTPGGSLSGSENPQRPPGGPSGTGPGAPRGVENAPTNPARPPFQAKPIKPQAPSDGAKAAMADWVARFKSGKVNLPEKKDFFRLVDAMKAAGIKGKVKDALDQVPPEILYPVLVEIGQMKTEAEAEAAGSATVEQRPADNAEAPAGGPTWPAPGSPCGIEDCKETAVDWRKQKDGIPVAVCKKHAGIIDEKRKASADRNREVK